MTDEAKSTSDTMLVGPFVLRFASEHNDEIVSGDGIVSVRVRGGTNACCVTGLLNLAYEQENIRGVSLNKVA